MAYGMHGRRKQEDYTMQPGSLSSLSVARYWALVPAREDGFQNVDEIAQSGVSTWDGNQM
jgi:hypothetical protein